MTTTELHDVLALAGYASRIKREEVEIEVCHFCGNDRWNLTLSPTLGVYWCWVCKTGGRLDQLLGTLTGRQFHIEAHLTTTRTPEEKALPSEFRALPADEVPSAVHYLKRRGFSALTAMQYEMRVCIEPGHLLEGRIIVPAREYWSGRLLGWVGRSYTGRRPKYVSTLPHRTVTGWRQSDRRQACVIVEGPFDGIAVHQLGYNAAVLGGLGGNVREFGQRCHPEQWIYVMLDSDAIARARQLFWEIKQVHPNNVAVVTPGVGEDPASMNRQALSTLLRSAALVS